MKKYLILLILFLISFQLIAQISIPKENKLLIYPNPAVDYINVVVKDTTFKPNILRIFDYQGKTMYYKQINEGPIKEDAIGHTVHKYYFNLSSGMYIVIVQNIEKECISARITVVNEQYRKR